MVDYLYLKEKEADMNKEKYENLVKEVEVINQKIAVLNCTLDDIMEIVQTIDESKNEELKNERY